MPSSNCSYYHHSITELEDFQLSSSEVVIQASTDRGCLTVSLIASTVVEGEEEVRLGISTNVDATVVAGTTIIAIAVDGGKFYPTRCTLITLCSICYGTM